MLSRSETMVSRIIGAMTSDPYTHVSIAFEKELSPMYSFARLGKYPLPGGLRLEYADKGYYRAHNQIPCALYALEVEDEAYDIAKEMVTGMLKKRDKYTYNVLGLMLCKLNIAYARPYHFFCSEFVSRVLEQSKAVELPKPASLMRPTDYTKVNGLKLLFKGKMFELAKFCSKARAAT